jgi:hypothetical protein
MDERLSKILAALVPSLDRAELRIADSSDPARIGTTVQGGPKFYELFLVNGGEHDIARMTMRTGGFATADDEIVKLNESTVEFGAVKAGGAQRLETLDPGILDFMLWYQLDLQFSDGTRIAASFEVPKTYSFRTENYEFCPTLAKKAYLFGLKPAPPSWGQTKRA